MCFVTSYLGATVLKVLLTMLPQENLLLEPMYEVP